MDVSTQIEASRPAVSVYPFALIIFGVVGWIAAFGLTLERFKVAADVDALLACDISPFISCKSVMLSSQAMLFGFPNPLIGLAAFAAPVVVGFAILAGAKFAKWFWALFMAGNLLGMVFVFWLFSQSAYSIGSLCIYCMVAWAAMIPMFWATLGKSAAIGALGSPLIAAGEKVLSWSWVLALLTYFGLLMAIIIQFWAFWPTLL